VGQRLEAEGFELAAKGFGKEFVPGEFARYRKRRRGALHGPEVVLLISSIKAGSGEPVLTYVTYEVSDYDRSRFHDYLAKLRSWTRGKGRGER
jgi:hypothetical protein